jgi:FkbM family methyltransferase
MARIVRRGLLKQGYVLLDKNKFMNLSDLLIFLMSRGISVTTVYDIGAHVGAWSNSIESLMGGQIEVVIFEPNTRHNEVLSKANRKIFNFILSDENQLLNFYSIGGTGDSIFRENSDHYTNIKPTQLPASRLDDLVEEHDLNFPDIVKIDVQGAEFKVLQGAARTISKASAVIIECQLLNRNEGGSQISDVLIFMTTLNFFPVAISEIHQVNGVIEEIDFVFLNNQLVSGQ